VRDRRKLLEKLMTLTVTVHSLYVYVTIAERYCDPLGNENIFSTVRPILRNNTSPVIVVAARVCTVCYCKELRFTCSNVDVQSYMKHISAAIQIGPIMHTMFLKG